MWQVQVDDTVYNAELTEVIEWINEGAVLPDHKVRRGDLRWLRADKVPELFPHFNRTVTSGLDAFAPEESGDPPTVTRFENQVAAAPEETDCETEPQSDGPSDDAAASAAALPERKALKKFCVSHRERRAEFVCGTCRLSFCRLCPNRFGSDVRTCPSCGALCISFTEAESLNNTRGALNRPYARRHDGETKPRKFFDTKIRLSDLLDAAKLPFRCPLQSLVVAVVFTLLALGVVTAALGGLWNIATAAVCLVIGSAFAFCVLSAISRSFAAEPDANAVLPRVRASGINDAVVRPVALSLAVLLMTFGLFFALTLGAAAYAVSQVNSSADTAESEMRAAGGGAARKHGGFEGLIKEKREDFVNSIMGEGYARENAALVKIVMTFMRLSVDFLAPLGLAFALGLVLLPAAACNAVESGSLIRSLNPLRILKTMKQHGFDYIKLLCTSFSAITAMLLAGYLSFASLYAASPLTGLLTSVAVVGVLSAYFSIAISRLLAVEVHRELDQPSMS
jgi:hypothetical protein